MSKERILVVDDEEDILELVRYNLAKEGYHVAGALTGEDALQKARSESFDLIVLDLMLPGIDGLEVTKKLKNSPKTESVPIHLKANLKDAKMKIIVEDRGIGIAKKHLPRLFERFYRVDKARSRNLGGTGLGLAIVKHIAQAHGGNVTVESTLGEGSVFTIHLPEK